MDLTNRPRPDIDAMNAFFWAGTRRGVLLFQRCDECGTLRHPPGLRCRRCGSATVTVVEARGDGSVFSYIVARRPELGFGEDLVIAVIELREGVRLISNVISADPSRLHIGMPVEVDFMSVEDDLVLPLFRPAAADR